MRKLITFCLAFMFLAPQAYAESGVYKVSASLPLEDAYQKVYESLEKNRFWVVFEANIGKNISGFADKWGEDYNRQKLEGIRSMVFCNGWYANQVSNADPDMLALCPLSLTMIHKDGQSTVLFVRPTAVAGNSPALTVLQELENEVIASIETALK
ncbi:MAG: DUF302 domain-containing protein [Gammaproteobacteria bacterium]|nr:DUF302 domain-containing protein [Gammaproteobacteria bacterium]